MTFTVTIEGRSYELEIDGDYTTVDGELPPMDDRYLIDTASRMLVGALQRNAKESE